MAFFVKRWYSSAVLRDPYAHARPSVANPCPVHQGPVLGSPELQKLAQKAKGHWKDLSKEEAVQCKLCTLSGTGCLCLKEVFYLMLTLFPISVQSFFPCYFQRVDS